MEPTSPSFPKQQSSKKSISRRSISSGVFEACFGGLDLSEFNNNNNHEEESHNRKAGPTMSAAAKLLQTKSLEARRSIEEAKEDETLAKNAAEFARGYAIASAVSTSDKNTLPPSRTNSLYSALVGMHAQDEFGANREKRNVSRLPPHKLVRRNAMVKSSSSKIAKISGLTLSRRATSNNKSNRSHIKKSRRSKF